MDALFSVRVIYTRSLQHHNRKAFSHICFTLRQVLLLSDLFNILQHLLSNNLSDSEYFNISSVDN